MTQHFRSRRTALVPLLLVVTVGFALYVLEQRRLQAAGFCEETGERLSDAEVLRTAEAYLRAGAAAEQRAGLSQGGSSTVRIVSEAELRAEDEVPAWVKNKGGFRAYVEIVSEHRKPRGQSGGPDLIIVSNCGKVRFAIYEYFGGWLW